MEKDMQTIVNIATENESYCIGELELYEPP